MAWSIMCCGCNRLMDKEVKASILFAGGGFVPTEFQTPYAGGNATVISDSVADFPDQTTADLHAKAYGWQIKDRDGPNHRCPECLTKEREKPTAGRGAYIEI